ncbi:MAG TPA: 4,5-DOPA dioxygenase extradiol [Candidatus Micrarchaeota archaeon]|nr:4,5-DOPA dioxygenase extradiol [Candidatus Micrarchaeota archaeon]
MPVLFIGHGSPMNAIEDNEFSLSWKKIAAKFPKPDSVLCISAHWQTKGSQVTAMEAPKTIHDFYGFPPELYEMQYPARGSPELAKIAKGMVKSAKVSLDNSWGLDHGAWSVLSRMYPKADMPVVQLSLDATLAPEGHLRIGTELKKLREEGVLILGSGNIVHNLMQMRLDSPPFPWTVDFDSKVKTTLDKGDFAQLANYQSFQSARFAVPTNEHYLPLLYAAGASDGETPMYFSEAYSYSSLSMRCVAFGL